MTSHNSKVKFALCLAFRQEYCTSFTWNVVYQSRWGPCQQEIKKFPDLRAMPHNKALLPCSRYKI